MSQPSLALIIPNFNDSRHIVNCLKSVFEQEILPEEIIVVDDCSTDNSIEIINAAITDHPKVQFIKNQKNLGVYGAIDVGFQHATSEYIMFLSANDFVFPGIFQHAKKCLEKYRETGIWSAMGWLINEDGQSLGALPQAIPALQDRYFSPAESIKLAKSLGNWFAGPTVVYHREIFDSVGRFNPDYKGLADLICALMVASKKGAVFSPVPYAVFRQHAGSYLTSTFANPENLLTLLQTLVENGTKITPTLFDDTFSERTIRRFIFTAIRQSNGKELISFGNVLAENIAKRLLLANYLIPLRFSLFRIIAAFLLLRPFDIWPSIWNRYLGTSLIAVKNTKKIEQSLRLMLIN